MLTVVTPPFSDEIRKSAGNAGIKTFTSKLDQGLLADAVTRGEVFTQHVPMFFLLILFPRTLYILLSTVRDDLDDDDFISKKLIFLFSLNMNIFWVSVSE